MVLRLARASSGGRLTLSLRCFVIGFTSAVVGGAASAVSWLVIQQWSASTPIVALLVALLAGGAVAAKTVRVLERVIDES